MNIMSKMFVFGTLLTLSGCAALGPEVPMSTVDSHEQNMAIAETAWQSLNIIDTLQTVQIAKNPNCYRESDIVTRHLIGEHPSQGKAIGIGIVYGVAHFAITKWLDYNDTLDEHGEYSSGWHVANISWQALTLLDKGVAVGNNFTIGLTPFNSRYHNCK